MPIRFINPIKLGLDLVLDGICVRAIVASHPLELVADIVGDPRVDFCFLLELILGQPANRVVAAQVKVVVVSFCLWIAAVGRSTSTKPEVAMR